MCWTKPPLWIPFHWWILLKTFKAQFEIWDLGFLEERNLKYRKRSVNYYIGRLRLLMLFVECCLQYYFGQATMILFLQWFECCKTCSILEHCGNWRNPLYEFLDLVVAFTRHLVLLSAGFSQRLQQSMLTIPVVVYSSARRQSISCGVMFEETVSLYS